MNILDLSQTLSLTLHITKSVLGNSLKCFIFFCLAKTFIISNIHASSPEKESPELSPRRLMAPEKRIDNFGIYYTKSALNADDIRDILNLLSPNPKVSGINYNNDTCSYHTPIQIGQDDHYRLKVRFHHSPKKFLSEEIKAVESKKTNSGIGQVTFITSFQSSVQDDLYDVYNLTLTVEDMRYALQPDTRDGKLKIDHQSVDLSNFDANEENIDDKESVEKEKEFSPLPDEHPVSSSHKKVISTISRLTSALANHIPSPSFTRRNMSSTDLHSSINKKNNEFSPRVRRAETSPQPVEQTSPTIREKKTNRFIRKSQSFRLPLKGKSQAMSTSPILKKQTNLSPKQDKKTDIAQTRKRAETSPKRVEQTSHVTREVKTDKSVRRSQSFRLPPKEKKQDTSFFSYLRNKQSPSSKEKENMTDKTPFPLEQQSTNGETSTSTTRKPISPCNVPKTILFFENLSQETKNIAK